jgi:hypothetical protein
VRSVILVAVVALGCRATSPTAVPIDVPAGQSFDLAIGESARIVALSASLTFLSVQEDSRCPVGSLILCVWEGNARVRLQVRSGDRTDTLDLNTTVEPKERFVGTLRIQLTALNPAPYDGSPIPKTSYRARLVARGTAD